ncbi:hypothetical protein [Roseivirga seohaensis]|uniref:hypothetical protein n=1 Tax=Roseivirga seohaensis TaxID=1914963 RepID=UPI003BAA7018
MQDKSNMAKMKSSTASKKEVKPTYEELLKKVEELSKIPTDLGERIEFFSQKREFISKRDKLIHVQNQIVEQEETLLKEMKEDDSFLSKKFSLKLSSERTYGEGTVLFKIDSSDLILSFIEQFKARISGKIEEFEALIQG